MYYLCNIVELFFFHYRNYNKPNIIEDAFDHTSVKNKQCQGFDFDRQKIVGNYIVDFYCSNCNVVIEIDGSSHDDKQEYDAARDSFLESLGLTVIHIPVVDVMKKMNGVMKMLFNHPALEGTPSIGGEFCTNRHFRLHLCRFTFANIPRKIQ